MNKVQLSELLEKYFNDTCTPEERVAINTWYDQYENSPALISELSPIARERLKTKMQAAIKSKISPEKPSTTVHSLYRRWWLTVAAAAVILVFVKLFFLNTDVKPNLAEQITFTNLTLTNSTKNILKQVLPDGSVVWLNPNASLSWPSRFLKGSRNVTMMGDCFFEVTKDAKHPFIISSAHLLTKVWGTSFSVHDGDNFTASKVTVLTGRVSVSKIGSSADKAAARLKSDEVMLQANDQVLLSINSAQLVATKQADVSDLNLYRHLNLSFENNKLSEIVAILNQKFDVHIMIRNEELENALMTADLNGLNLPEVLEVLKTSMKLNYEISKTLIVLKKNN
jgi:transmembrane sensor